MTRALAPVLLLIPLLAGCVAAPSPGAVEAADASDSTGPPPYVREGREEIVAAFTVPCPGDPTRIECTLRAGSWVEFMVPPGRVLEGALTATWTAKTPLAESLTVRVGAKSGDGAAVEGTGTSPLVIDLAPTGFATGTYFARAFAEAPLPLVVQEVHYEWRLVVQGESHRD